MNPINIGTIRQLFLDDHVVDRLDKIHRQFHRPVRHDGNPIIESDQKWEHGGGVYLYGGTVIYDREERRFKMWYRASSPLVRTEGSGFDVAEGTYKACYAVSDDGLHWHKPDLGLTEFAGSRANNLLPPSKDGKGFIRRPNLVKDYDDPDPGRRYKMVYMDNIDGQWGLSKGISADGISWQMNVGQPHRFEKPVAPNGVLFGWDAGNAEFVHYHRKSGTVRADVDGRTVRTKSAVMRTSSADFETWGGTREVLTRSEADPPGWSPSHGIDLAGVQLTEGLYIGFVDTVTRHFVEDVPPDAWDGVHSKEFAEYRTELLVSRDGQKWDRVAPMWEFMRRGLWGTWDRDHVGLGKPIVHDDQMLLYYLGSNIPLASNLPDHPQFPVLNTIVDGQRMGHAIGLATMRLDGFVSMDGYDPTGTVTTKPLTSDGDRLVLNARAPQAAFDAEPQAAAPYGSLRAEVLDAQGRAIEGYSADDCDAFTGDDLRHVVTWRGRPRLPRLDGGAFKLRFHLRNAALYSFQVADREPGSQDVELAEPGSRGAP
jgi:hypothetical protein